MSTNKISFSTWLTLKATEGNAKLIESINGSAEHPMKKTFSDYFEAASIKINAERLELAKKLISSISPDKAEAIATLTEADFYPKVSSIPFTFIAMTENPNSHNYGGSYFLVIRYSNGYRSDGSTGNSFPTYESGKWKVADGAKIAELVTKYVALAKAGNNEFSEYIAAIRMYADPFVDFSELE